MQKNHARMIAYGGLTIGMMVLIFCLSAQDATESGNLSKWLLNTAFGQTLVRILPRLSENGEGADLRKYAHMGEYFLLAVFSFGFFREVTLERIPRKAFLFSLTLNFLYACTDEIHQLFVPGRAGRFTDVLVDTAGTLAALLLLVLAAALRKERK